MTTVIRATAQTTMAIANDHSGLPVAAQQSMA